MAVRNIILTADDFGACDYIDRGIYEAIDQGVVTCVSAFVNFKPRKAGEEGEKYIGSEKALRALDEKHPHLPIGLHLTINTGTPVSKNNLVPGLIQHAGQKNPGHFKNIMTFSGKVTFTDRFVRQIGVEARAQIQRFREILGREPNHISCHFGILFIFKNFLEELLKPGGISGIPVRNPIMLFQTPNKENQTNSRILAKAKTFFKRNSKMRDEGKKKAVTWLKDGTDSALGIIFQGATVRSRLKSLMKHKCHFPDYTVGSLYMRGPNDPKDWEGGLAKYLGQIPLFIPKFYTQNENRKGGVVAEFICHLGTGNIPATSPVGINHDYFEGRDIELKRLIEARNVLAVNSLNLVDFDFLEDQDIA